MSQNFENNKIFGAVLIAGLAAFFAAFIGDSLIYPEKLEKNAVEIAGGEVASGGPAKVAMPDPILSLIATADVAKGEKLSKACAACHSFDKGGPNKVGPNLYGVVNNQKAAHGGFAYSEAMSSFGGDWSYAELNKFLWKPKKYVSGTKMNYIGIKKPADRAAMIAWLRSLADSPAALPTQAQIDTEIAELAPPEPAAEDMPSEEAPADAH